MYSSAHQKIQIMRLTIDLDDKKDLKKVLNKVSTLFGQGFIDRIYLSSSKKGYHLITYGLKQSYEENLILRSVLNDDKARISIDRLKLKKTKNGLNVLWTSKNGKRVKKVYDREKGVNILPQRLRHIA